MITESTKVKLKALGFTRITLRGMGLYACSDERPNGVTIYSVLDCKEVEGYMGNYGLESSSIICNTTGECLVNLTYRQPTEQL